MQDLAGDERGVLQVDDRFNDVVDLPQPTQRVGCREGFVRRRRCIGVRMTPRATALDRMPRSAYSIASAFVTAFNPPLVSDASADGDCDRAWSTRLVEMFTR